MEYQNHSCEHADHEYGGTIKHSILWPHRSTSDLVADIFFLDATGGHKPYYHGCCVRYSDEPSDYGSFAEVRIIQYKPVLWAMYLQWCENHGYKPQSNEWITQNTKIDLAKRDCYVDQD